MADYNCKYYKQVRQVSYDSGVTWINIGEVQKGDLYEYNAPSCGGVKEYRWVDVTGAYTCVGTTKYQKTKKQESTDGGSTWQDVSPAEYGTGAVIEYASTDCGYDPTYANEYLTFIPRETGRFKYTSYMGTSKYVLNTVYYSLDGGTTWTQLPNATYTPNVEAGQKIMWKGNFSSISHAVGILTNSFGSTGEFDIEGNIMSLVFSDNFQGKTDLSGTRYIFESIFAWEDVVSAQHLILPATQLGMGCYNFMFGGCRSLVTPPELPATTLARECYVGMFQGCWSLVAAPALPATQLADECYNSMFRDCTSLAAAPELPAATLTDRCYKQMFDGCTSLAQVKCLATDISADACTYYWVRDVSSSGTFTKASSMSEWTTGTNGIPNNWTVQNA